MEKRDLVIKFLRNECTAEEAEQAMQFINGDPGILDELAPKAEWDMPATEIPQHIEESIRGHVSAATTRGKLAALWKPLAAAAAVMIFITGAYILMPVKKEKAVVAGNIFGAPAFDRIVNGDNNVQEVLLADGSRLSLHPGSAVIYSTAKDKRDIYLTGKAVFNVAKNPNAPFTVYSGGITTTALGTVFMVDAGKTATNINVQLYEGKVVVRSVNAQLAIGDTYLFPGEQCNIDLALAQVKVTKIGEVMAGNNNRDYIAGTVKGNSAGELVLDFKKVPLTATFDRLEKIFGKEIVFNGNETGHELFTGHFDKSDSLSQILQIIAVMNGLQVEQQGDKFLLFNKAANTNMAPVKMHEQTVNETTPGLLPLPEKPAVIPPAVTDSNLHTVQSDANGMRIADVPAGKDYRKVPLWLVFDQVAERNNVKIKYQKEEIRDLYFTGTIPNDNSSIEMLPVICRMNGLKLIKKKRGEYTVKLARQ